MLNKFLKQILAHDEIYKEKEIVERLSNNVDYARVNTFNNLKSINHKALNKLYCLFPVSADTLSVFLNKEKIDIKLKGINHNNSKSNNSKKAISLLNDLVKKQHVYFERDNNEYTLYLDESKSESINSIIIERNLHLPSNDVNSVDIKNSYENKDNSKKCYGLFATSSSEFLGMYDNRKITFKISGINFENENLLEAKASKKIIYDHISKKMVFFDIINESNDKIEANIFLDKEKNNSLSKLINNSDDSVKLQDDTIENNDEIINYDEVKIPKMFSMKNTANSTGKKLSFGKK